MHSYVSWDSDSSDSSSDSDDDEFGSTSTMPCPRIALPFPLHSSNSSTPIDNAELFRKQMDEELNSILKKESSFKKEMIQTKIMKLSNLLNEIESLGKRPQFESSNSKKRKTQHQQIYDATKEKVIYCLSSRTRSSLDVHILFIENFYKSLVISLNILKSRSEQSGDIKNFQSCFVELFVKNFQVASDSTVIAHGKKTNFASSSSSRYVKSQPQTSYHSIFWLHGPCGQGKSSWVKNFWSLTLGVDVVTWNISHSKSFRLAHIRESLLNAFNSLSTPSLLESDHTKDIESPLRPIILEDLDSLFECYEAADKKNLLNVVLEILKSRAFLSNSNIGYGSHPIVYITTSQKSTFEIRSLADVLGIYKVQTISGGAGNQFSSIKFNRMIKFYSTSDDEVVSYLRYISENHEKAPSFFKQCLNIRRVLKLLDSEGNYDFSPFIPSSSTIGIRNLFYEMDIICGLHVDEFNSKGTTTKVSQHSRPKTAMSSIVLTLSSADADVRLSSILYPKMYKLTLNAYIEIFETCIRSFTAASLMKQLSLNEGLSYTRNVVMSCTDGLPYDNRVCSNNSSLASVDTQRASLMRIINLFVRCNISKSPSAYIAKSEHILLNILQHLLWLSSYLQAPKNPTSDFINCVRWR